MEVAASRGVPATREAASWDAETHLSEGYRDIDYDPVSPSPEWSKASSVEPGREHGRTAVPRPVPSSENDADLPGAHGYREQQHENPGIFGAAPDLPDADAALREAVLERVSKLRGFDGRDLEVRVRGGDVTLRGVVDQVAVRDTIAAAVGEVVGVLRVENDLRIACALDIFPRRSDDRH
ncbi:MAG: BON domain-containing protein [Polyangiaceae bacterium]|nr:BON domain-containing protein [Polyangiaceae bacterium]